MPDGIIIVATKMEKELLYWVFSTVVQAFVALLALVGMVGIYWISKLDKVIEETKDTIKNTYFDYFQNEDTKLIIEEEFVKAVNQMKLSTKEHPVDIDKFKIFKANLNCNYKEKQIFTIYFIIFAIITIIDIILSLILLRYTTWLAEFKYINLVILGVIGLSLLSLLLALLLIIRAIMPKILKKEITKYIK